jgi:hypothetical protein
MPLRYNETGEGLDGYSWVPISQVPIGSIVYHQGDMRVERIHTTEHAFVQSQPVVYGMSLTSYRDVCFYCPTTQTSVLVKVPKQQE